MVAAARYARIEIAGRHGIMTTCAWSATCWPAAGRGCERHLLEVDLKFTHYGPFPEDFDPILREAIDLVVDTDGTAAHLEASLIDAFGLLQALGDASSGLTFGDLGRLRFTFDVTDLDVEPADVVVRVEMAEAGHPNGVTIGPWPAASPVDAGVPRIGRDMSFVRRPSRQQRSSRSGRHPTSTCRRRRT